MSWTLYLYTVKVNSIMVLLYTLYIYTIKVNSVVVLLSIYQEFSIDLLLGRKNYM